MQFEIIEQKGCAVRLGGVDLETGQTFRAEGTGGQVAYLRVLKVNNTKNRAIGRIYAGNVISKEKKCKLLDSPTLRLYDVRANSKRRASAFYGLDLYGYAAITSLDSANLALGEGSASKYAMRTYGLGVRAFPASFFTKAFPSRNLGLQLLIQLVFRDLRVRLEAALDPLDLDVLVPEECRNGFCDGLRASASTGTAKRRVSRK